MTGVFLTDEERLNDWREMQILDLGFAPQQAEIMVKLLPQWRSWHDVEKLIRGGWTPEQVIEVFS